MNFQQIDWVSVFIGVIGIVILYQAFRWYQGYQNSDPAYDSNNRPSDGDPYQQLQYEPSYQQTIISQPWLNSYLPSRFQLSKGWPKWGSHDRYRNPHYDSYRKTPYKNNPYRNNPYDRYRNASYNRDRSQTYVNVV